MRQYIGFGTPAETNARFKYLMAHGQDALNVAFDLPTQLGLDSDDPRAEGEVGRVGMAIDSLARHGGGVRRHRRRPRVHLVHDQLHGGLHPGDVPRGGGEAGRRRGTASSRRRRTTSSRSSSPAGRGSIRWTPRSGWSATSSSSARGTRRSSNPDLGLRLPHPRGRLHPRPGDGVRARSSSPRTRSCWWSAACPSTSSRRACRSTSRAGASSSRKSRSSARAGGCTPG